MPDDYTYTPLQNYMLGVCADDSIPPLEKYIRIYQALPVTDEGCREIYFGPGGDSGISDNWGGPDPEAEKRCEALLENAASHVPVHMIIRKYKELAEAKASDIAAITDLRRISPDGLYVFIKGEWGALRSHYYYDYGLVPPDLVNLKYRYKPESPDRQLEFMNLLLAQSEDFLLTFMLNVLLTPYGVAANCDFKPGVSRDRDNAIAYASFENMADFPKWYRAWNRLVPTMCQRDEGSELLPWGDFPQKACGNLVEDEKYQMPLARYCELQAKNLIDEESKVDPGDSVAECPVPPQR